MIKLTCVIALITVCGGVPLYAQAPVGTIPGTVTDATGAVVPSSPTTVTNKATNVGRSLTAKASSRCLWARRFL
jgi:hypothetical protein